MRLLYRLGDALDIVISALTVALLVAISGIVTVAVVLRYGFNAPLTYSYDLATVLFAWMVFLGLALAERDRAHLAVDVLDMSLGPRARTVLVVLRQLALVALTLTVAWIGWRLTTRAGMIMPSMRISIRWLYASLPIGCAVLALAQLLVLPRLVAQARGLLPARDAA
jgi:TRAP-type C4-dicarboxylate transport system permease small subunit